MDVGIKVELTGIKELESKFKQLSEKLIKRALKRAISSGAEIVRADAERRVMPFSKRLGGGIISKVSTQKESATVKIGPESKLWWGRFIELGHNIYAGRRRRRFAQIIGRVPAHPFLRPAIDENEERVVDAVAQEFQKEIRGACK